MKGLFLAPNGGIYPRRNGNQVMKLHNDIDALFDQILHGGFEPASYHGQTPFNAQDDMFVPNIELRSDDKQYSAIVELPGVNPDDVKITVQGDAIIVKGEKKSETKQEENGHIRTECHYGTFERSITLPDDADCDNITAASKHGVLTISIPRKAIPTNEVKQISIDKHE